MPSSAFNINSNGGKGINIYTLEANVQMEKIISCGEDRSHGIVAQVMDELERQCL